MIQLPNEILDILKGATADLWDGPEDTAFLQEVAVETAKQYEELALAQDDAARDKALVNIKLWKSAVVLRAEQKALKLKPLGKQILDVVLGLLGDAAKLYLAGKQNQ